ncbi:MAG: chromate transporter [Chloroflexi bacterium]|nr:chromate transporter [Chloroflexota bacterium]
MVDPYVLWELFFSFARLSLFAVGGIQAVISEVYREVVEVHGWMTAAELAALVALAQAAPGPNGLMLALVGYRLAGVPGFFVSVVAVALPPAVVAFAFTRARRRLATSRWLRVAQTGLVPVVVGLMLASGLVSARAADDTWLKVALTGVVALTVWRTSWNPLWWLAVGALVGLTRF